MKFSDSHEWIQVEGAVGIVGITEYAQRELGEIVYVELPSVGKQVAAGKEVAVLESTKAAADIYSPVSGEIIEINQGLNTHVGKINSTPQTEGWLFKIKLSKLEELDLLLDREHYLELVQ